MMRLYFYIVTVCFASIELGLPQYLSPVFYRSFSNGCLSASIKRRNDCPLARRKDQWSRERKTAESDKKFKAMSDPSKEISQKCYHKVSVQTQKCNAVPKCVMTTYRYNLPKPLGNVDPEKCANDWSMETKCKVNGPGGENTKSVFFHCFTRRDKPYCGVKFEPCKVEQCFEWGRWERQCYVECPTQPISEVALRHVRHCKECDGDVTDTNNCQGKPTRLRRCVLREKARSRIPDCITDKPSTLYTTTTKKPTATEKATTSKVHTPEKPSTTKSISTTTDTTSTTLIVTTKKTVLATTKEETTTPLSTTAKRRLTERPTTEKPTREKSTSTLAPTISVIPSTDQPTTKTPATTADVTTHFKSTAVKILGPRFEVATSAVNETVLAIPAGYNASDSGAFNLTAIVSGAGAGVVFAFLVAVTMVLLSRRRDTKSKPDADHNSSSVYRSRPAKNPVVKSSSFRIATWTGDQPALPNTNRPSSDSGVSDAEYWGLDTSSEDVTASSAPGQSGELRSEAPDVARAVFSQNNDEHIYEEVSFQDFDAAGTFISREHTPRQRHYISVNSSQSEPAFRSIEKPKRESAVFAVVRKTRKAQLAMAKNIAPDLEGTNDVRRRIASEHSASVTRLNGRQLREGVLKIEFDENKGIRCKLSESDVYINLEDKEPSLVT